MPESDDIARRRSRRRRVIALAIAAVLLVGALAWLAQPRGERLVQVKCFRCHPRPSVVYGVRKDREGWERTVRRMEDLGMGVTDEQRDAIVDWLAEERGG